MEGNSDEELVYEIGIVVPKRVVREEDDEGCLDAVEILVDELKKTGLVVDRVLGLTDEFIKLAAPLETLGKAAADLHIKKPTCIGMDLTFEWDEVEAFVKQPDGSLFSWCERYRCYNYLIYGIEGKSKADVALKFGNKNICWEQWEPLLKRLETEGVVKQVFPLHDERKRKHLLRSWALNWWDLTKQPIDDIYLYFGPKIAMYFAFLGMYTKWLLFPASLGIILQFVDFGSLQFLVLPFFFIMVISWAVFLFQFWKRKNYALLARWQISYTTGTGPGFKVLGMEWNPLPQPMEIAKKMTLDKVKEKEVYQRDEWFERLTRFKNDAIVVISIICLQLPFELLYAHLYESVESDIVKFGLTAVYLVAIQYFTRIGGKKSVELIKVEKNENREYRADSLVYKAFGLYFMQTYIGIFYHALLHRNIMTLRKVLIQRLIVSEVFENLLENSLPYLKYNYKKYRAVRNKKKHDKGSSIDKIRFASRVEKEYLKPAYAASIGEELEDGLFDDFLEMALQFGMIMMFACAFPPAFAFAAVNNIMEIRTDALKLLTVLKRPVPRAAGTIGAWLNIFQEPAWVRAKRLKNVSHAQDVCSKQLLRTISVKEARPEKED